MRRAAHAAKAVVPALCRRTNGRGALTYAPLFAATGAAALLLAPESPARADAPAKAAKQRVYIWGRRDCLPGGAQTDALNPQRAAWFESHNALWKKLALGPDFGVALDEEGRAFVWGSAGDGFVGPVALKLTGDAKDHRFSDVQCSSTKIFALNAAGQVFVVDGLREALNQRAEDKKRAPESPLVLESFFVRGLPQPGFLSRRGLLNSGNRFVQMSIGLEHAAFLNKKGEVYCVGGNEWGQCAVKPATQKGPMGALEDRTRMELELPTKVAFPEGAQAMKMVKVGGRHTFCQDVTGQVFSFGDDRRIQLGLGDTRSTAADQRNAVGVLNREQLGGQKTATEMKRRVNYRYYSPHLTWKPTKTIEPKAVNRPEYPPPHEIAAGEDFSLFVVRDSPDWYENEEKVTSVIMACGENAEGQCGRNWQQQQQVWTSVRLPKYSKISAVDCGQGHSLALLSNGELFAWGQNIHGQIGCGNRAPQCPPVKVWLAGPPPARPRDKDGNFIGEKPEGPKQPTVLSVACGFRASGVIAMAPEES